MTAQETLAYRQAWANYEKSGHNVDKLSPADVAALRTDPTTRRNIDAARPVDVTTRPAAKAAPIPPPWPDFEEMSTALHETAEAYLESGLNGLDSTKSNMVAVFCKYAGTGETPRALVIRQVLTQNALDMALSLIGHLNIEVKKLKAAPSKSIEYKGVWNQETVYGVGNAVTHAGSLWIAKSANVSRRPGSGDGSWQLAVKSGAPGKDCQCKCGAGDKGPQ